jgi:glycosyltransferase involved in cell wall biosynthesis
MECAEDVREHLRPDIVVAEAGKTMEIARKFVDLGLPTIASIRDVEFGQKGGDCFLHPLLKYVSNSKFTQMRLKESFGIESTVIYPVIDSSRYATPTNGQYVLHINPYPKKGIDTTMKLAQLRPDVKFLICESWMLSAAERKKLNAKYGGLENVTFRKPTSDMRELYAGAKCLIVPSLWQEAWGRVVTEAHCSGIPVIARAVGGLPEAVGPGGILVEPSASIDVWSSALSRLLDNPEQHQIMSQCVLDYSQRKEISPKHLVDTLVQIIEGHLKSSRSTKSR